MHRNPSNRYKYDAHVTETTSLQHYVQRRLKNQLRLAFLLCSKYYNNGALSLHVPSVVTMTNAHFTVCQLHKKVNNELRNFGNIYCQIYQKKLKANTQVPFYLPRVFICAFYLHRYCKSSTTLKQIQTGSVVSYILITEVTPTLRSDRG